MFAQRNYDSYEDDDDDSFLEDSGDEIEKYIIINDENTKNDFTNKKTIDKGDVTSNINDPAKLCDANNIKNINKLTNIVQEFTLNNDGISYKNGADNDFAKINKIVRLQNYPSLKISFNRDTFAKRIDASEMSELIKTDKQDNNEIIDQKCILSKEEKEKMPYNLEIDRILFDKMKKSFYDDDLDLNTFWFTKLHESLNSNQSMTAFTNILENCWLDVDDIYSAALYFIENLGKKIFHVNLVLRSLFDFLQNNFKMNNNQTFNSGLKQECSHIIKLKAFIHITKAQVIPNNLHMFDKCFNISSGDKNIFTQIVRILLKNHQYIKASRCINLANLHDKFTVDEICFPLLFQGHVQELEKHLNGNKKEQEIFLSSLDLLFEHPDNLNSKLRDYHVPKMRLELLRNKSLLKLALRLAKLYNINEALLKNISLIQAEKTIRYLAYRKFFLKDLINDDWTSIIQGITKDSQKLQLFLMDILIDYCEFDEASRFAFLLNIPPDILPSQISLNQNISNNLNEKDDTIGDCNDDYFKLILPIKNVLWVDTENLFFEFLNSIQEEGPYVGFDAEWKPNFGGSIKANQISIIQLATCQHIYLLDILTLINLIDQSSWIKFGDNIFGNPNLFIIGYGCNTDFPNLFQTIPALQQCLNMDIVDLASYHSLMESDAGEKLRGGLNDLAFRCLGKALDKRQQMSDWNRRPLNDAQILYAAIDAYCLVEIHEKLSLQFSELKTSRAKKHIQFIQSKLERKQINASLNITERPDKRPDEMYSGEKQGYSLLHRSKTGPTAAGSVKVVCDVMLAGLGRTLRSCGLDVFPSTHNLTVRELVEISKNEKRVVLTTGTPYYSLRQHVDLGSCVKITKDNIENQLKQVFELFNLYLCKEDILSRCQACNSCDLFEIDAVNLKSLRNHLANNKHNLINIESSNDEFSNGIDLKRHKSSDNESGNYKYNDRGSSEETKNCKFNFNESINYDSNNQKFSNHKTSNHQLSSHESGELVSTNCESIPTLSSFIHPSQEDVELKDLAAELLVIILKKNIRIKFNDVSVEKYEKVNSFFVCVGCGKIYWEGLHHDRTLNKFAFAFK